MFYCSTQRTAEFKLQFNCETFFQLNEAYSMKADADFIAYNIYFSFRGVLLLNKYLLTAREPLGADETVVVCMVCLEERKQIYFSSQVVPRAPFALFCLVKLRTFAFEFVY